MRTIGNILWFIFGGLLGGLAWIFENPHLYGTFHNVVLKNLELKELKRRFPYDWKDWII